MELHEELIGLVQLAKMYRRNDGTNSNIQNVDKFMGGCEVFAAIADISIEKAQDKVARWVAILDNDPPLNSYFSSE